MIFEIPLLAGTPQSLQINLGGVDVVLTLRYRDATDGGWILDIDDANKNALVHGIALVTGIDLLEQYAYIGLPGGLFLQSASNPDAVPTFDSLGVDAKLYWVPTT